VAQEARRGAARGAALLVFALLLPDIQLTRPVAQVVWCST